MKQMSGCWSWKKKECQLQRISGGVLIKKNAANVDLISGMMFFCILILTIFFGFRITQYMVTSAIAEDALAASNLASAVIDVEEYGRTHRLWIADGKRAFEIYKDALQSNMKLDTQLYSSNNDLILGQVQIKEYIVYNVNGQDIEIEVYDGNGTLTFAGMGREGDVFTPDGICVENTTIYSKIGFEVVGLAGQSFAGEKEKSIDIARWNSE